MPDLRMCTAALGWLCCGPMGLLGAMSTAAAHAQHAAWGARGPVDISSLDGLTIFLILAVIAAFAGLIVYRTPTKPFGGSHEDRTFWRSLAKPGERYLGVLYEDADQYAARRYTVRRIRVTLKHRDPAWDEIVHHEDTFHNDVGLFQRIDRAAALACWLETAEARRLPAVYRRKGKLQALSPDQLQAALSDPAAFSAAFLEYLLNGKPLPEGKIEDPT